ncbi:uncharacterized protein EAF01_000237 [Botrytis porri]|uniref:uncharacterized protein n=1 Tax=Botrytis porri TaxID=87229 RepID=UPI001900EB39|nr:uncharacterized protein EAF01_000237 [Botrytis porri]KAF7913831.1 hypothetical protein EAF01_000237 [Botrytis porri]
MPSLPLNTFSSEEEFKYIDILNLKSSVPKFKKSRDSTAIEATQNLKRREQHILISEHGILLLSGVLCDGQKVAPSSEEDNEHDMLEKDELVVSKEVGIVRGRQIVDFRRTFEHLPVSQEMKKDHTMYIDFVTHDLIHAHCFEPKYSPWRATQRRHSNFIKRKRGTRSANSSRHSWSNVSFYKEYNQAPPLKQEKTTSAAHKLHKSIEQHISQAPAE